MVVDEADITKWAVTIHGPPGTDFEGKRPSWSSFFFVVSQLIVLYFFLKKKAAFSMRCSLFQKTILFRLLL